MEPFETGPIHRIEYPVTELTPLPDPEAVPEEDKQQSGSKLGKILRGQFLGALAICLVVLTMQFWWPGGVKAARQWLVCEEASPLEEAAQAFVSDVLQGESVEDAVVAFCLEVLDHAQPTEDSSITQEGQNATETEPQPLATP